MYMRGMYKIEKEDIALRIAVSSTGEKATETGGVVSAMFNSIKNSSRCQETFAQILTLSLAEFCSL